MSRISRLDTVMTPHLPFHIIFSRTIVYMSFNTRKEAVRLSLGWWYWFAQQFSPPPPISCGLAPGTCAERTAFAKAVVECSWLEVCGWVRLFVFPSNWNDMQFSLILYHGHFARHGMIYTTERGEDKIQSYGSCYVECIITLSPLIRLGSVSSYAVWLCVPSLTRW